MSVKARTIGLTVAVAGLLLLFASSLTPVPAADADPALRGLWDFAEGSGDVLHDTSASKNDGKITGGTWIEIPGGHALSLDGKADVVTLPAVPSFYSTFDRTWTVEMWVKPETITPGPKMLFDKPFTKHDRPYYQIRLAIQLSDADSNKAYDLVIVRPSDGGVSLGAYGPADSAVAGEWAHIVATFDRNTTTLRLYKNGVRIAECKKPTDPTAAYDNFATGAALGGMLNNPGGYAFNGVIAEARLYNKVLSAEAVKTRYNERAEKFGLKILP